MSEAVPMVIADLEISEISEKDLENTFQRVVVAHKDAVKSIQTSMQDADDVYRKYLNPDYIPLEDVAKKDRAELNKAEKNIADQYSILKKAYEKPLQNIDENIKQIRKVIKDASSTVDNAVKVYVEKQQKHKQIEIEDFFATKKFDLVPLEKIFDQKWLNKTKSMKEVREEMEAKISAIYRDIETLEIIPDHGMAAKAFYLENLDMGAALRQVEAIKENAAKLAREQEERENRKTDEQLSANSRAERQERREEKKEEAVKNYLDQIEGAPIGSTVKKEREEIIDFTLTFKGTKEQLQRLKEYMTANGIVYTKGLLLESEDHARQMMRAKNVAGRIYYFIYVPAV